LQELFLPLAECIKRGDLRNFDLALQKGEDEFVKKRIYLTLERGRDIALRNLLRKVFMAGGFDEAKEGETTPARRTRVLVSEFRAAICMGSGGEPIDTDEVECLLANMIYKVSLDITSIIFCPSSRRPTIAHPSPIDVVIRPVPRHILLPWHQTWSPGRLGAKATEMLHANQADQLPLLQQPLTALVAGSDEGLHCSRKRHRSLVKERRLSRNGSMSRTRIRSDEDSRICPVALKMTRTIQNKSDVTFSIASQ
jgi:hypothetical protein